MENIKRELITVHFQTLNLVTLLAPPHLNLTQITNRNTEPKKGTPARTDHKQGTKNLENNIQIAKIQITDNTNCWRGESNKKLLSLPVGMQTRPATVEDSLAASYRAKHGLTISSSNHTSRIYPNDLRTYIYTKSHTQKFDSHFVHNHPN